MLFQSKNEKIAQPIQGFSGIYSLKLLSELIWFIEFVLKTFWLNCI